MSARTVSYRVHTYLSDALSAAIASSTNASPIKIKTAAAHGFLTDDIVRIENHLVNTAANGTWTIIKVDGDEFTLTGSVGNGVGGATGTAWPAENTFTDAAIAAPPEIPGQLVRPHLGRTETVRGTVELLDTAEA
ncbi:unnamed protein product, partial [marine sediment metagenome]